LQLYVSRIETVQHVVERSRQPADFVLRTVVLDAPLKILPAAYVARFGGQPVDRSQRIACKQPTGSAGDN